MTRDHGEPRAAIVGLAGPVLLPEEAELFRRLPPLGFILFGRNIVDPVQVDRLVADLRHAVGRADAPIAIDQEGGRVARLRPPHWPSYYPGAKFGQLAQVGLAPATRAAFLQARLIANDLHLLGIDVDCHPVVDLAVPGAHEVIGDRAFGETPDVVAALGRAACEGLLAGGVLPVIKHLPGHGRARADSHLELPVVGAAIDDLRETDFAPFRALNDMPIAMTAHIVFSALDPQLALTESALGIERIARGMLGFQGVLVSDDIAMAALSGSPAERTRRVLAAGCDLVLQCDGRFDALIEVLGAAPPLAGEAARRWNRAAARRRAPAPLDSFAAREELDTLMAEALA